MLPPSVSLIPGTLYQWKETKRRLKHVELFLFGLGLELFYSILCHFNNLSVIS